MGHGGLRVASHLEQMGTDGVEPVMARQRSVERLEQLQAGGRAVGHGRRDSPVERHHRVAGHPFKQAVQGEDLRPVGVLDALRTVVGGRDEGLHLVLADHAVGQRRRDQGHPLGDQRPVPQRPVLLCQRDQLAARTGAGGPPGVREQHQR